jgi:hypothetical protein
MSDHLKVKLDIIWKLSTCSFVKKTTKQQAGFSEVKNDSKTEMSASTLSGRGVKRKNW